VRRLVFLLSQRRRCGGHSARSEAPRTARPSVCWKEVDTCFAIRGVEVSIQRFHFVPGLEDRFEKRVRRGAGCFLRATFSSTFTPQISMLEAAVAQPQWQTFFELQNFCAAYVLMCNLSRSRNDFDSMVSTGSGSFAGTSDDNSPSKFDLNSFEAKNTASAVCLSARH
jgi:hypothetical protein